MKKIAVFLAFAGLAMPAGEPSGFHFWSAAELKNHAKALAPKINAQKVASETLAAFGNYSFMLAHREGDGEAEYHELQADVFVVQSGEATLVVGGKIDKGRTSAPNEIRGPSIVGGTEKKLAAGDVVTIPAKTPHQLKMPPGKEFTYFVVKITQ